MMAAKVLREVGSLKQTTEGQISLRSLSAMTGFPVDFIKSELLIKGDDINLEDLRESMIHFLEKNKEILL